MQQWGDEYGRHPVGTGPYVFEDWIPGSQITFVRNENYQQFRTDVKNTGLPLADKVILLVIPEEGTVQAALETGEILVGDLAADIVARFVGDPNFNVVIDKNVANVVFLEFNFLKPPFDDPVVREAVSYAVDRQAAVNAAWNGYAEIAYSPLPLGDPGFDPAIAEEYGTPYDPAKALELFLQAGFTQTDDGIMLDPEGNPVVWKVTSYAGFTHINRTLEVVQANLKDLGIEVQLETAEWGAFYPTLLEDDWHMDLMRWTNRDPSILNGIYRSPGHREKTPAGAYDEVLDRCNATIDPDARNECVKEAQILLMENYMSIPILSNWTMYAVQNFVKDYTIDFMGYLLPGDVWLDK
jgi:peptide/nickel transport system substrate-binding protein